MKKITVILLLINLIFVSSALSFAIPDGSGGSYYGDIYKAPDYSYLNKDLNEIINAVLEGVATATPPEEGVPVFPYDPILYYLLIRGFGLDASMQQRVMQYLNKSFLESKKESFRKEIKERYTRWELNSFELAQRSSTNLKNFNLNRLAKEYLIPAGWKINVVNVCDNLNKLITCRNLDFDQTLNGFIRHVSGLFQLGTYCGIKYEEIPFCENQTPQTIVLSPQGNNLFANIFKAFTGKIMIAQVGGETTSTEEGIPPVIIYNRLNYSLEDMKHSEIVEKLYSDLWQASLNSPPPKRLGEYKRVISCIRDDDNRLFPYETEAVDFIGRLPNQTSEISISPSTNVGGFDFKEFTRRTIFEGVDIFSFQSGTEIANYIVNQCASKRLSSTLADLDLSKSSAFSDCVISNLRLLVDLNNSVVRIFKDLKNKIENLYVNTLWAEVIKKVDPPQVPIHAALKEILRDLYWVYIRKGEEISNLKINEDIRMPTNLSGCVIKIKSPTDIQYTNCDVLLNTANRISDLLKNLKIAIDFLASDPPYSELAVIHYTLDYFYPANDIYENCYLSRNIVNEKTYGYYNEKSKFANIKKVKIVKKIETNKSFKNFIGSFSNFITSLFSPKEFTIKIER